jgi:1,4-alpha-glucan branching enzyme
VRELIALRKRLPALRGHGFRVIHAHDANRVLMFQRWVEGQGQDVIVAIHLCPFHRFGYRVGMPAGGRWAEVFNSDVYENWVNPGVVGNGGGVDADTVPMHGEEHSASLMLPANSIIVLAR